MLKVHQVFKQYQDKPLLENISFHIQKNHTICLLGPSGGGKSTLLRIIAGLEHPDSGNIFWMGENITEREPHLRNFGLMFQDYALFPHMNVMENTAFGLRMQKLDEDEILLRTRQALEMVHMDQFTNRRVTDLSGGEQQRVALARTLAPRPHLIMLDEPLGALDRTLRAKLSDELRNLLHQIDIPVIYVTHDQDEAFSIADRILILNKGHIIQSGEPAEVYSKPSNLWLASFLGLENQISGEVKNKNPLNVETDIGLFRINCSEKQFNQGDKVTLVLRPTGAVAEKLELQTNVFTGRVQENIYSADRYKVSIIFNKNHCFNFFFHQPLQVQKEVTLTIPPESILCYKSD